MTLNNKIPIELRNFIDGEETDFIVKSKRNYPKSKALGLLFFSLLWSAIVSFFIVVIIGKEVNFQTNEIFTKASLENLKSMLPFVLIIGFFILIGIGLFIYAIVLFFQKGAYFVGTETRFIKYRNRTFIAKDWEQFSGNIKVKSKTIYGTLELELRTGKMKKRDKAPDKFVPDIIYIAGVKNVFDIEKKCRIRIKENDPTPSRNIT